MKRKILFSIILTIFGALLIFLGYKTYKVIKIKKDATAKTKQLPALPFEFLSKLNDLSGQSVIINYFSPDCDHCQYMTNQIIINKKKFINTQIVMIAADKLGVLKKFKKDYGLDSISFLSMGSDPSYRFFTIFGSVSVPSFYIYNSKHILVKIIIGETKINNLLMTAK